MASSLRGIVSSYLVSISVECPDGTDVPLNKLYYFEFNKKPSQKLHHLKQNTSAYHYCHHPPSGVHIQMFSSMAYPSLAQLDVIGLIASLVSNVKTFLYIIFLLNYRVLFKLSFLVNG